MTETIIITSSQFFYYNNLEKNNQLLKFQIDRLEAENKFLNLKIRNNNDIENLVRRYNNLKRDNDALYKRLKKVTELKSEIKNLKEEINILKEEVEKKEPSIEHLSKFFKEKLEILSQILYRQKCKNYF